MESRLWKLSLVFFAPALMGASFSTQNFVVTAPSPQIAKQVGLAAEQYRKQLAIDWVGHELAPWAARCPIEVTVGQIGAGGATTFSFFPKAHGPAEVCNWNMKIRGSLERILDSVLPHEVSHTIFACHFRRPLPRWADEGAATLAEHESEKRRQVLTARQVIGTQRRIPLKNLLNIKEYPKDDQDVLTLYAEGYSLAELLVQQGGRARYMKFIGDANQLGWDKALQMHYGYRGVDALEKRWYDWIVAGSPEIQQDGVQLAEVVTPPRAAQPAKLIIRGQKPPEDPFLGDSALAMVDVAQPGNRNSAEVVEPNTLPALGKSAPRLTTNRSAEKADANLNHEPPRANSNPSRQPNPSTTTDRKVAISRTAIARTDVTQPLKKEKKKDVQFAEARTSSKPRQVTEWSEFPQDPRPSPFRLPIRKPSDARP